MEQPLQYIPQSRHVVPGSAALEGVSSCFVHFLSARSWSLLQMASVLNTHAAQIHFEAVPGTRPFFPEILLVSAQEKLLNTLPSTAPHHRAFSCLCLFCFCRLILLGFSKLLAWFRTLLLEDPHQQQQHTNSSSDSTKGVDPVNVIHGVHIQRSHFGAELFSYPFTMQPAPVARGLRGRAFFMAWAAAILQLVTTVRATDARCLAHGSRWLTNKSASFA